MHTFVGSCCHTRIVGSGKSNGLHDEVIATGPVAHHYIIRGGRRSLFLVAIDEEALTVCPSEEQLLHHRWVAVEADDHRTVWGQQCLKHLGIQAVRMLRVSFEDQQIRDIDHAHT